MADLKKYHSTAFDDAYAVRLISGILEQHHLIKTAFLQQDKTPNTDGYFTVLSENGTPIKVFIVQIKSTHSLPLKTEGINTGKYIYEAELPFFYYIYSGVDSNPAIFFIANLETNQVFYKYLSDEYLGSLPFENKKYFTIKFVPSEQIVDDKTFYNEMLVIIEEYNLFRDIRKKAGLNDVRELSIKETTNKQTKFDLLDCLYPIFYFLKVILFVLLTGITFVATVKIVEKLINLLSQTIQAGPVPGPDHSVEINIYGLLYLIASFLFILIIKRTANVISECFDTISIEQCVNYNSVFFAESFSIGDIVWGDYRICRITEKNGSLHHIMAFSSNMEHLVSIYPIENIAFKQLLPTPNSTEHPSIYPQIYSYETLNETLLFAVEQYRSGLTLEEFVHSHPGENEINLILNDLLTCLVNTQSLITDDCYTAWQRFLPCNMIITSSNNLCITGYESIGVFESRRDFFTCCVKDIVSTFLFLITYGSYTPKHNYLSAEDLNKVIDANGINKSWAILLDKLMSLEYEEALQGVECIKHKIGADLSPYNM